jgi:hypothetical protein
MLEGLIIPWIENFEAQSGSADGKETTDTILVVSNITSSPNPNARPFYSDPVNEQWKAATRAEQKAEARASTSKRAPSLAALSTQMTSGFSEVVSAIRSITPPTPSPAIQMGGINWTPIVQGLVSGLRCIITFKTEG